MKATPTKPLEFEDEDTGEFACFGTLDAIAAYIHHKYGEEFLREAFKASGEHARESLEDTATELDRRGLYHLGHLLRDIAEDYPSGIEFNPYEDDRPTGGHNWQYWRQSWLRTRQLAAGDLKSKMKRQGSRKRRQSAAGTSKPASHKH